MLTPWRVGADSASQALRSRIDAIELGRSDSYDATKHQLLLLKPQIANAPADLQQRYEILLCWYFDGTDEQALQHAQLMLARVEVVGSARQQLEYRLCRGHYRRQLGDLPGAIADLRIALSQARQLGDARLLGDANSMLGSALVATQQDLASGLSYLVASQFFYRQVGADYWLYEVQFDLANTYFQLGFPQMALQLYQQVEQQTRYQTPSNRQSTAYQLGSVLATLEHYPEAIAQFQTATELARQLARSQDAAAAQLMLAAVLLAKPPVDLVAVEAALASAEQEQPAAQWDQNQRVIRQLVLAGIARERGQLHSALALIEQALGLTENRPTSLLRSRILAAHSALLQLSGDLGRAYAVKLQQEALDKQRAAVMQQHYQALMSSVLEVVNHEAEIEHLRREQLLKQRELESNQRVAYWQRWTLLFAAALLLLVSGLALQLFKRSSYYGRLALIDPLTQLNNRRRIDQLLSTAMRRCRQHQQPLSVAMVDLDNFKLINDQFGHDAGDRVLIAAAQAIQQALRIVDYVGRYGGEEFLLVLPGASLAEARRVAERVRESVEQLVLWEAGAVVRVSTSIGVAQVELTQKLPTIALRHADEALYQAKHGGRNRVVVASEYG